MALPRAFMPRTNAQRGGRVAARAPDLSRDRRRRFLVSSERPCEQRHRRRAGATTRCCLRPEDRELIARLVELLEDTARPVPPRLSALAVDRDAFDATAEEIAQ